jgi:hypothetical protein
MGPDKEGGLSAVQEFLKSTNEFVMDPSFPGTIISCSPSGFLKRKARSSGAICSGPMPRQFLAS